MSIFERPVPDKAEAPEVSDCGNCPDKPEPHRTENSALHPLSGAGTACGTAGAADDILLAALIAMLFGSRADDELLLILVLLYIFGFAEK